MGGAVVVVPLPGLCPANWAGSPTLSSSTASPISPTASGGGGVNVVVACSHDGVVFEPVCEVRREAIVVDDDGWSMWLCVHPLDQLGYEDRMTAGSLTSADGVAWESHGDVLARHPRHLGRPRHPRHRRGLPRPPRRAVRRAPHAVRPPSPPRRQHPLLRRGRPPGRRPRPRHHARPGLATLRTRSRSAASRGPSRRTEGRRGVVQVAVSVLGTSGSR